MSRLFSSSLFALIALAAAAWLSPASASQCSAGNGTCFVVAGGGNSNNTATWANSSGGATCSCLPASTDNVVLDSAAGQLTINANLSVGTFDASGNGPGGNASPWTGTLTQATSTTLTINVASGNSLRFTSSMTYSPATITSIVSIAITSGGLGVLTSGGKNFAQLNINSTSPFGIAQGDNLSVTAAQSSAIQINTGVFSAGSFTTTAGAIVSNNAGNVRSVTLGGLVKLGGNVATGLTLWNFNTLSGITFTKNNANIEIVPPTSGISALTFAGGGQAYNNLTIDPNTASGIQGTYLALTGSNNTFSNLTIGGGWNFQLPSAATTTVTGAFAINGTAASPVIFQFAGASSTMAVGGTCTATYAYISQVAGTGSCGTYQASNSGNLQGAAAGWNIRPPVVGVIGG